VRARWWGRSPCKVCCEFQARSWLTKGTPWRRCPHPLHIRSSLLLHLHTGAAAAGLKRPIIVLSDDEPAAGAPGTASPLAGRTHLAGAVAPTAASSSDNYDTPHLMLHGIPNPIFPKPGGSVKLRFDLTNTGLIPFKKGMLMQIWSNYTGDTTEACGVAGEAQLKLPPLNPGETKRLKTVTLKMPASPGQVLLAVVVDSACLTWNKVQGPG
jgi:hypothetical protein